MPRLSDSMEEGTILRWLRADGDDVARGDELVEIETDKATMTYEADQDGVLTIVAAEGTTLPIGEVIARLGEAAGPNGGDPAAATAPEPEPEPEAPEVEEPVAPVASPPGDRGAADAQLQEAPASAPVASPPGDRGAADAQLQEAPASRERLKASPVARRIAREHGL